jgi:hypothetical protein
MVVKIQPNVLSVTSPNGRGAIDPTGDGIDASEAGARGFFDFDEEEE